MIRRNHLRQRYLLLLSALALPAPVLAQTAPRSFATATRYDIAGRVMGTIGAPQAASGTQGPFLATRNTYDAYGNLVTTEEGQLANWQDDTVSPANWGAFTVSKARSYGYDNYGRKTSEQLFAGPVSSGQIAAVTQYSYDLYGRVVCTAVRMDALQWGSQSDPCVPQTNGSQGPDRIMKTAYDYLGNVLTVQQAVGTSLQQNYQTYTWDTSTGGAGKPATVADANGNLTSYTYGGTGLNLLTQWNFPSPTSAGQSSNSDYEKYAYDANGNRTSMRKRDGTSFTYTFDALNHLTQKVAPASASGAPGYTVNYGYNLQGQQTSAVFASGSGITNVYNGFGEGVSTTSNMDGTNRTISSQFDGDGNRTQVSEPTGYLINYGYDGSDRMSYLSEASGQNVVQITYDATGSRHQLALAPNGTSSVISAYDGVGRLNNEQYLYVNGSGNQTWTSQYNPAGQVTLSTSSNDAYAWSGAINASRNYGVNGLNQYQTAGSVTFGYDANGNLTSDGSNTYVYDAENRLVSVSGGRNATLSYDPLGRLWRVAGSGETRFEYDGDRLLQEYDGTGSVTGSYAHGPGSDEPLIWYTPGGRRYLLADHQGSVNGLSDDGGYPQSINAYDEYGVPKIGNVGRFQYTGQAWVSEIGMYYYKARIYSPTLGRFMQTDPVGYKDQMSLYAYVANDPVNMRDPRGTDAVVVVNPDGTRTLVIPVAYSGSGANPTAIAQVANSITVSGSKDTIKVVPTTTPIQGVINRMDVSPGYDYKTYPTAGEGQVAGPGPQGTGGNLAHINSSSGQVNQAAAHDTLHFGGLTDKYVEGPKDAAGNRTSAPAPGYNNSNIMTSRSGTTINQSQFNEALQNPTTKVCTVSRTNACN